MIRVRDGDVSDAGAMAAVNAAGWRAGYRGLVPDDYLERLPVAQWRREITAGLRSPRGDSFTRIAELDGGFAGYCFVAAPGREERDDSRVAELVALYVEPDRWGRGAGGALVEIAVAESEARGYERIELWTFEANERALRLYERHGFRRDGGRRRFPKTGTPTVRLSRPLP
ncbi:MAG: GNAT family N-acetyltransferase [Solirubrobacterales bacterium]